MREQSLFITPVCGSCESEELRGYGSKVVDCTGCGENGVNVEFRTQDGIVCDSKGFYEVDLEDYRGLE